MSSYIEILDDLGVNLDAIITDIVKNLPGFLFSNSSLVYKQVSCNGEEDYILLSQEGVESFHNGTESVLTEQHFSIGSLVEETVDPVVLTEIGFVEFGNKFLLDALEQTLLLEITEKTPENIDTAVKDNLVDLIFYLSVKEPDAIYRAMENFHKSIKNVVAENRDKEPIRTMRSGRVKSMELI